MLEPIILAALSVYGHKAVEAVKENIRTKPVTLRGQYATYSQPVNTSGQTAESVELFLEGTSLTITAAKHAFTVEYGRGPGPIGKAGMENLARWMQIRGIEAGAIWAIRKSIEKKGTLMYQQVKKSGILDIFQEGELSINELMAQLSDSVAADVRSNILRQWQ